MTRARPKPVHPARTLTVIWQSASLLLDYPDEPLLDMQEYLIGVKSRRRAK